MLKIRNNTNIYIVGNDMLREVVLKYNKIVGSAGTNNKQQILTLMRDTNIYDLLVSYLIYISW